MEEKLFELMTKMYSDLTRQLGVVDQRLDSMDRRFDVLEDKVDANTTELKSLGNQVTVMEHDLKNDIKALYDGYQQTYEKVVTLENKFEKQDVEIRVIRGGK